MFSKTFAILLLVGTTLALPVEEPEVQDFHLKKVLHKIVHTAHKVATLGAEVAIIGAILGSHLGKRGVDETDLNQVFGDRNIVSNEEQYFDFSNIFKHEKKVITAEVVNDIADKVGKRDADEAAPNTHVVKLIENLKILSQHLQEIDPRLLEGTVEENQDLSFGSIIKHESNTVKHVSKTAHSAAEIASNAGKVEQDIEGTFGKKQVEEVEVQDINWKNLIDHVVKLVQDIGQVAEDIVLIIQDIKG